MSKEDSLPDLLADDTSDDENTTIRMSQVDISPVMMSKPKLIPTGYSNSRGEQELFTGRTNSRGEPEVVYGFVDPRVASRTPTNPYEDTPSYESPFAKGASIDGSYHQRSGSYAHSMEQERKNLISSRAFSTSYPPMYAPAAAPYSSAPNAPFQYVGGPNAPFQNVGGPNAPFQNVGGPESDELPFTYAECMDAAFEKLKNQAKGNYETTNGSKNVSVQIGNIQKKGHNLMIAENVSADLDHSTAMNVIADKLEQVLENNGVVQAFVKFDLDMGMHTGLGSRIEAASTACQAELQKLAVFLEMTEEKKDHDKEMADEKKQARTAEWVKEAAEERLSQEDIKNKSTVEFDKYFKEILTEKHVWVDFELKLKVDHSNRLIESTNYKMAKLRKDLTVFQIMVQLLDAYVYVIQAITAEVITAMKNHKSIIIEASTQTTHTFSGRSSTNPHNEARLSCIYQSLTKGRQVHMARTFSLFMDLASSLPPSTLSKDPMRGYNEIMAFMQLLHQSGSIKYFLNSDTIAMCLILCRYREAPLAVTTAMFNIVNETEKKRKLQPNSPTKKYEMVNEVRELLKLQTTVKEFRTNSFAGKEVVDLTDESPTSHVHVPKRPYVPQNRRNESGYAAQAQVPKKYENLARHIHTKPITRMDGINYFLGSSRTVYVAVRTAAEVCSKCCIEAAPGDWHPQRCYTKQCIRCRLFGHSEKHCRQKV